MKAKSEKRRLFISKQLNECRDASGLFYILSFQKGYILNWDVQKNVWDYVFSQDCYRANFAENPLIITEPQFNFPTIQEAMIEIFFEEYDCCALLKTTTADLCQAKYTNESTWDDPPLCCLVIDMSYSFTHIVPFIKGKKYKPGIRRIDIGGKLLTNHMKEIISYRQLNVMDESYVINQVKEDSCFVSHHFYDDMKTAKKRFPENSIVREYVLPDFTTIKRGFVRKPDRNKTDDYQILKLNNERFAIPELLFHPSDIGINQMGVPETVINSVDACPEATRPHLLANIVVIGGSAKFPGMQSRLLKEIRCLAPDWYDVNVKLPEE
jgi:actin-related protein 6